MVKIAINLRQDYAKMKLPKPRKRGDSYRIELMINGKRLSATKDTAKECTEWAIAKIAESKTQSKEKTTMSFAELLSLYHQKVGKYKPSVKTEYIYYKTFLRDFNTLAQMQIHHITAKELTDWRNARLKTVSAGSVRREISYLSSVMSYAVRELFLISENPFINLQKPPMPKPRNRRISDDEIDQILKAGNYEKWHTPTQTQQYVAWAFLFAIHTAMRRGEILGITKDNIKDGYIHLPKTKNGDSRNVPLSKFAKQMLGWVNNDSDKLIPFDENAFKKSWLRVQKKAGLDNVTFHDTRHEAISRFVANYQMPVEKLAKITGHKDIKTLINVYYNPTIDDLIEFLQ